LLRGGKPREKAEDLEWLYVAPNGAKVATLAWVGAEDGVTTVCCVGPFRT
jgi:hypothetical protein